MKETVDLATFESLGAAHFITPPADVDWHAVANDWRDVVFDAYNYARDDDAAGLAAYLVEVFVRVPLWIRAEYQKFDDDLIAEEVLDGEDYARWLDEHIDGIAPVSPL